MQAASRDSLAEVRTQLDALVDASAKKKDVETLRRIGAELFDVVTLLAQERTLRHHLADPSAPQEVRTGLVDALFGGKVADQTADLLRRVAGARWSEPQDLVDGVEALAAQATLAVAEKDGAIEEVEDELFRFGRILVAQPRLRALLADPTTPADRRVGLLDSLTTGKVHAVTAGLLRQVVRTPRGRSLEVAIEALAELAAARRDRYVAHVTAPVALSDEQERRLTETLTRVYGRAISLQVELDPDVLGGLVIRVGDEVVDGSVSGRLDKARQRLAGG